VALALALALIIVTPRTGLAAASETTLRWPGVTAAQEDDPAAGAAAAAVEFSRLEAANDFEALYEHMHPDARAVVPRSAVIGWYENFQTDREPGELSVTGVTLEPWTWPVTGVTYPEAATVSYTQPYTSDGATTDVTGEVHLAPVDGEWYWFFGASKDFVDQQIALYGDDGSAVAFALAQGTAEQTPLPRDVRFPDPLHADIDRFWTTRFQEAGRAYHPPNGVVAFDRPITTACGRANPDEEAAFYCVLDETIYYSSDFRKLIEQQIGDFAWVIVVAHEWGHHIQSLLGFDLGVVPDRAGDQPAVEYEHQADCMAGAYSKDAELTGWLDAGDIQEAIDMTELSGDPPGTAWNDPRAHGTGDERVDMFMQGYNGGLSACDLDLSQAPPADG
jgi:predicted metalloprotease